MKPEMKHTPGPWNISKHGTPEHSPQFGIYADGDRNDFGIVRYDNAEANARLIAAAPDLLEELQSILSTARVVDAGNKNEHGENCCGFAAEVFNRAQAAINKATNQ